MPLMQHPDSGCIVIALGTGDVFIGGQGGNGLGTLFFKQSEPGEQGRTTAEYDGKSIAEIGPEIMVMFSANRQAHAAIEHLIGVLKGIAEHINDPATTNQAEGLATTTTDTATFEPTGETVPLLQLRVADARRLRDIVNLALENNASKFGLNWARKTLAAAIDLHDRATAEGEAGR